MFMPETPSHPHSGALTHELRNRGYSLHYHPSNALSHPDVLVEARPLTHLTQSGGGCWLAYRRSSPWPSMVHPLILTSNSIRTTTCAVELTILTGAKAAITPCYLPQPGKGARPGLRGTSPTTHHTPTSPSYNGMRLTKGLGRHSLEGPTHKVYFLREMDDAHDPHHSTTLATI